MTKMSIFYNMKVITHTCKSDINTKDLIYSDMSEMDNGKGA